MTDLAAAYAQLADVDHACSLLAESLAIAAQAGLADHRSRIMGVRTRLLEQWRDEPAVARLDEQLRAIR
jgi:hypothetical protein